MNKSTAARATMSDSLLKISAALEAPVTMLSLRRQRQRASSAPIHQKTSAKTVTDPTRTFKAAIMVSRRKVMMAKSIVIGKMFRTSGLIRVKIQLVVSKSFIELIILFLLIRTAD